MRDWRQGELNGVALIVGGILLVAMSVGGYFLGSLLDRVLKTSPICAIAGLIIGTMVGFWDLYRTAARIMNQQPLPSPEAQQRAQHMWENAEKSEKSELDEGFRDETHEK